MRLDKYLSNIGIGSRKEVKKYIEDGYVFVNGKNIRKSKTEVDLNIDKIVLNNKEIITANYIYLMVNKPKSIICQTKSLSRKTIIDILPNNLQKMDLSPAGRLDYDTEGLVILTNDGKFLQDIIDPNKNIFKKYYARVDKKLNQFDIEKFKKGFYLEKEDHYTLESKLEIIGDYECYVYIKEGKYHQVKRMLGFCGKEVLYLKRISIGSLSLDESLEKGKYRQLTDFEIENLKIDINRNKIKDIK